MYFVIIVVYTIVKYTFLNVVVGGSCG